MWILKGVVAEGVEQPGWMPLDLPGEGPTPRKAHSLAGDKHRSPTPLEHNQAMAFLEARLSDILRTGLDASFGKTLLERLERGSIHTTCLHIPVLKRLYS